MVEAIVPAFNEELTIASVVETLVASGLPVLVVDDGSIDATAERASVAGARVMRISSNGGKAEAMRAGLAQVRAPLVAFFDADLVGLRPVHVIRMLEAAGRGYDMVCGVRDYGVFGNTLQLVSPLITGERILRRWVLDVIPDSCWRGYAIETAMNEAVRRYGGRTAVVPMRGVTIRTKVDKAGMVEGLAGHLEMFSRIASVERCLGENGDCEAR